MFRLETLGGLALTDGPAAPVTAQRRRLALLALLAVAGERGLSRDKLVAYLWADSPSDNARHALEQLLYALRRQLGDALFLGPDPLRLNPDLITSDVAQFGQAVGGGAPAEAVELYRGPFLDGFYLSDAAEFERWAEEERSRLAGKYAWALEGLAEAAHNRRDYAAEIGWRRRLVATDPLNGLSALSLMRALASAGDGAGALQYARVYETMMRAELDTVPDPPIQAFQRELRAAQSVAAVADGLAPPDAGVGANGGPPVGLTSLPAEPAQVPPDTSPPPRALAAEEAVTHRGAMHLPSRRLVAALAACVTVVTCAVVAFIWQPHRAVNEPTDPRLVAVFPFRVAGADPELGYLGEGIVDLLAVKLTGEGGPRALDPRALLGAWHRARASTAEDLSRAAAVGVASRLGAGRLVDGAVVGTPSHLVLTASIVTVPSGTMRARTSVEGTADSLPALIDRLTAALLAGESGRTDLATLTSLPALRAYLDGQSELRAGRFKDAFRSFSHALEVDSTFLLAGIGLGRARFWEGGNDSGRGFRLAWAGRDRLSPRDRAIIAPWMVPGEEHLATAQLAVAALPESPEAWYELGDDYYHGGGLQGMDAPLRRAAAAFRRALELDSSMAEPRIHLFEIAAAEGDTAAIRRLGNMAMAADSGNDDAGYFRWQMAYTLRDTVALAALRAGFDQLSDKNLRAIAVRSQEFGATLDDARRAAAVLLKRAASDSARRAAMRLQYELALNGGRPHEALGPLVESERSYDQVGHWPGRVMDALYWGGDSGAAAVWVRNMASYVDGPLLRGVDERRTQIDDICTMEQWRVAHGQLAAHAAIRRLRAAFVPGLPARDSASVAAHASMCADLLEAWPPTGVRRPDDSALVARLDSLSRRRPEGWWADGWNLVLAQMLEARGEVHEALATVRRRPYGFGRAEPYLSSYLRAEGRLAALAGDTAGATSAYRHFLALRSDPEPLLRAERDRARAEVARLVGQH